MANLERRIKQMSRGDQVDTLEEVKALKDDFMTKLYRERVIEMNKQELLSSSYTYKRKSVNVALKEAVQLMNSEIEKSAAHLVNLDSSAGIVQKTATVYDKMTDYLGISKKITRTLKSKDATDRMLLYVGIAVFLLTCLYIISKRVWIPFL